MIFAAMLLLALAIASAVAVEVVKGRDLEIVPSAVWLLLITVPFLFQYSTFPAEYSGRQALGIIAVSVGLLVGDLLAGRRGLGKRQPPGACVISVILRSPWTYASVFALIAVTHIVSVEHVPLWEKYIGHESDARLLQEYREAASKLLHVPDWLKYAFNWVVNICAPIGVLLFWTKGRRMAALVFLTAALLYANLTLAKVPTFLLFATLAAFVLFSRRPSTRMKAYIAGGMVGALLVSVAILTLQRDPESIFNFEPNAERIDALGLAESDPRSRLTVGDRARFRSYDDASNMSLFATRAEYYIYRIFLVPVEVSSRWYQYFPAYSSGFIGAEGLAPGSRSAAYAHPAQRVGNWAYTERFPQWYRRTVHAYASLDADAYARYGMGGIAIAAGFIMFVRLILSGLKVDDALGRGLYINGVILLGLLAPMASVQAILIANGLAIVCVLQVFYYMCARRAHMRWA